MKLDKFERLAPPGIDYEKEIRMYITWLTVAVLYSLPVLLRYKSRYGELFYVNIRHLESYNGNPAKYLFPDAEMAPLNEVLGTHMLGFAVVAIAMIGVAVYHYIYHRQGSKSIYLMKRLPDRMVYHRRCLSLPLLGIAVAIGVGLLFFGIYAAIYFFVTPEEALAAGQLSNIWRIRL